MNSSSHSATVLSPLDLSAEVVISTPRFGLVQYSGTRAALEAEALFPAANWPTCPAESTWLDGRVACRLYFDQKTDRWIYSRSITFSSVADCCAALASTRCPVEGRSKAAMKRASGDAAFQHFKAALGLREVS